MDGSVVVVVVMRLRLRRGRPRLRLGGFGAESSVGDDVQPGLSCLMDEGLSCGDARAGMLSLPRFEVEE